MPNRKGTYFENQVKKIFESKGYYVVRSAASRGVFDLIAIKDGKPIGIQCKVGRIPKRELEIIKETGRRYGIVPYTAIKVNRKIQISPVL